MFNDAYLSSSRIQVKIRSQCRKCESSIEFTKLEFRATGDYYILRFSFEKIKKMSTREERKRKRPPWGSNPRPQG